VPTFNTKLFNVIFAIAVLACLVISLMSTGTVRLAMLELGVVFISVKLIYIMHNQASVNHFELWILSSIEWRINEMFKKIKEMHNAISSG
jgi:hypothetical protein